MPTKILVIETPNFQLGANAGDKAEKIEASAFPARLKEHNASKEENLLFVLAPEEIRYQGIFSEAAAGPGSVSVAFFPKTEDAIRFLPSIFLFATETRSIGVKNSLAPGSAIYSESFFNGKAVGSKLDPVFAFARRHLSSLAATNAWGSIQALVFQGLQSLPDQGEKGSGEKVDVQIGADEKMLTLTVRFDLAADKVSAARSSSLIALPRSASGVFESRYTADGKKIEFNCIFFRNGGPARPIEIQTHNCITALENAEMVKEYEFKTFSSISAEVAEEKKSPKAKGGFKKNFSSQVSPNAAEKEAPPAISAENAPYVAKVVVSGSATTGATGHDPLAKRDVLSSIKDSQSDVLKQKIKTLESEVEEIKERERELMKMVDKAVQMKDEAAKKIKELEFKVKQAGGNKGSKEQMLEKQLEEAKRQNKELAARLGDMMAKQRAGKAA